MNYEAKYPVKATVTTLSLIDALSELDSATVTELSDAVDIAPSAVHKHLSTLREHDYVVKDGSTYRLGFRFLSLGGYVRHRTPLYNSARGHLQTLAEETGERTNLAVEESGHGVYLYRSMGTEAVEMDTYIGQETHLHNTALGKALLAYLPDERVEQIIDMQGLPSTAKRTITDRETLFKELRQTRERGVAFDDEERLNRIRCVAAPILNDDERPLGAISVSGPRSRMSDERFHEEIPELLTQKTNLIEIDLTY